MDAQHTNIKLMELLLQWDPLGYGEGSYETEVVDVLQAVYAYEEVKQLARKIQAIYEFSFEEVIPLQICEDLAVKLFTIKDNSSCEI
ncbi:hypothetical protein JOC75_003480 [Metabacillus crassostreae]|uniref:DUF1871 family protein n=1 Tax=Metabacillus crassostreae TaxID=929098 RepID=UPI0019590FDC|nr:DUF1871 family protein [Metabacillus crassostreae]MBM7605457.1 hypothetical protein [Metabacillus crassostreae]